LREDGKKSEIEKQQKELLQLLGDQPAAPDNENSPRSANMANFPTLPIIPPSPQTSEATQISIPIPASRSLDTESSQSKPSDQSSASSYPAPLTRSNSSSSPSSSQGMLEPAICASCNLAINGPALQALNKKWHPHCFVCSVCKKPLTNSFLQMDGQNYCAEDYNRVFGKTCAGCQQLISGQFIRAMNKEWHPSGCFVCVNCKGLLSSGFFDKNGHPYCKNCVQ